MDRIDRFEFTVERADQGEVAVVIVHGEMDLVTAPRVGGAVAAAGELAGVVVDLSEVGFLDSSGLSELLVAERSLEGRLAIVCAPAGAVHRLMGVAGLEQALPLFHSRAAAVEAVGGPGLEPGTSCL